jgi:hypothetical protein
MTHRLTFYPIGNADTLFIDLAGGRVLVVDYADMRNPNDRYDRRWDIRSDIAGKLDGKRRSYVDVFCITHLDNDHVCGAADFFYLEHAAKYQTPGRYEIKELWVPAGAITEEGCEDAARIWRQEARHRLKVGKGIRVFARPERLKAWLEANGLSLESRKDFITDAGNDVPGFAADADGVQFFLHSPHGHRIDARQVEDRNQDSVVMQATFRAGGADTRVMLGGDTTWESMEDIVRISKQHGNAAKLEFDVFKLPHHCSYKSLSDVKGETKTDPKPLVREWFEMAADRAIVISTSDPVKNADQVQPPHFQAAEFHRENVRKVSGRFLVTMEEPTVGSPKPLVLKIDRWGAAVENQSSGSSSAAGQTPPRAGSR